MIICNHCGKPIPWAQDYVQSAHVHCHAKAQAEERATIETETIKGVLALLDEEIASWLREDPNGYDEGDEALRLARGRVSRGDWRKR